jgi:hypothetical protein
MKQVIIAFMLICGTFITANAQDGYRMHGGHGHWGYAQSYRGAYHDCRPGVRVIAPAPVYYAPAPVVYAPAPRVVYAPAPPVVYVHRPRVVINAGFRL